MRHILNFLQLDRTEDPDPMVPENKNVDPTVPKDSEGLTDVDLCAPDTFFTQGNHLSTCFILCSSTVITPACGFKYW